jgi:hypothetical protein
MQKVKMKSLVKSAMCCRVQNLTQRSSRNVLWNVYTVYLINADGVWILSAITYLRQKYTAIFFALFTTLFRDETLPFY